jgi:hypothetical protein
MARPWGRWRRRRRRGCRLRDSCNHRHRRLDHRSCRKTQNPYALSAQPGVSLSVVLHLPQFQVHRSIDLHTQPGCRAIEVEDVRSNRVLSTEAQAQLLAAQHSPQIPFGGCARPAKPPRTCMDRGDGFQSGLHSCGTPSVACDATSPMLRMVEDPTATPNWVKPAASTSSARSRIHSARSSANSGR